MRDVYSHECGEGMVPPQRNEKVSKMSKTAKKPARKNAVPVTVGAVTYPTVAAAARGCGVPYMVMYLRLKVLGWTAGQAAHRKVRSYKKSA